METISHDGQPEPLRCSNCNAPLNLNDETLDQDVSCHTCGSRSPLAQRPLGAQRVGAMVGNFRLLELVGTGRFGAVYRAFDTKLSRIVAVKIPRCDDLSLYTRNMFEREARAVAALNHPNIVRLYDVEVVEGQRIIVSEFIFGDDLKVFLGADGFASTNEIVKFMLTTVEAVQHAHSRGVIHRDLKPGNIIVDRDGQPHLADFGLAKIDSSDMTLSTFEDKLVGTLAYMSPEQAGGRIHDAKAPSDIFSLGVILYELLTGERPFPGASLPDTVYKICHTEPVSPCVLRPEVPRDLETICLKALSKAPGDRYSSAKELANDLRRFLEGKPTVARPATSVERAARWLKGNSTIATVCLMGVLSTTVAAMFPLRATMSSYPEVMLTSDPPGAQIRLFPLDPVTGEPVDAKVVRTRGTTPLSARVPPGDYLVVAKLDDGRFHEVYRHVPVDPQRTSEHYFHKNWAADNRGRIIVPVVSIPRFDVDRQMVAFSDEREFSMDPHEVTVVEFRKPFNGEFPGHLRPAIVRDDHPMTTTSYDRAVMYAELVGKRLPSAKEFEFAATNGRTTRFPWGNGQRTISSSLAPVGTVEFDQTSGETPVYGLCSNGGEFTSTPFRANYSSYKNVVAKIPLSIQALSDDEVTVAGKPLDGKASVEPIGLPRQFIAPDVGFRCVRSKTPRW